MSQRCPDLFLSRGHAPCWAPLLQPAQQVGMESGQRTVWKKETRDRIKVLKMRPGTQDLLGQEPCSSEPHHSYLVSWQAQSICCATMKSASCVPSHISHFIDYFKLSVIFLYKGYHLAGGHRPAYALGKHLSVCTSNVLNLR